MAETTKKRGKWAKLTVSIRVRLKRGAPKRKAREIAAVLALRGNFPRWFEVVRVAWANPDAEHFREQIKPTQEWLNDSANGLPTLNRGNWLEKLLIQEIGPDAENQINDGLLASKKPARKKNRKSVTKRRSKGSVRSVRGSGRTARKSRSKKSKPRPKQRKLPNRGVRRRMAVSKRKNYGRKGKR
jgi:hypothetical protein